MIFFAPRVFVCPFCFDAHRFGDAFFRCARSHLCPDGAPVFQVPEINGQRPDVREANCPGSNCNRPTKIRLCPTCQGQLPASLGECTSLPIGLLGEKYTGKSHYVGVLIDRIKKLLAVPGNPFQCAFRLEGDVSRQRYERDFERYLFRESFIIPETVSGSANDRVRQPVAGQLRFSGKLNFLQKVRRWRWTDRQEPLRDIQMSFFDTAGEDLATADIMGAECRYLANARGLILLLDPLQIPALRQELIEKGGLPPHRLPPPRSAPWKLLDTLIEILQTKDPKNKPRIRVPLAVAFSKCDELDNIVSPGHPAWPSADGTLEEEHLGRSDGRFDWLAHNEVQNAAARMLGKYGCGDMLNNLSAHFESFSLFFVSSLGHAPTADGKLGQLKPRRMLDPFLWLLAIHKVIPSVGERKNPEF